VLGRQTKRAWSLIFDERARSSTTQTIAVSGALGVIGHRAVREFGIFERARSILRRPLHSDSPFYLHARRSGTISPVGNCTGNRPPSPSPARGRPSRGATGLYASCASFHMAGRETTSRCIILSAKGGAKSSAVCGRQPIARFLRWTALRSKNNAWLTSAETVDCWYGLETRKAGSGRSPVRKRSG
jgi:hypothetical protein